VTGTGQFALVAFVVVLVLLCSRTTKRVLRIDAVFGWRMEAQIPEAEPPNQSVLGSPAAVPAIPDSLSLPDVLCPVHMQGIPEHDTMQLDGGCLGCLAHITAQRVGDGDGARTPIDIAAAVDCSSSIRSAMPLIRRTMEFVVSELRSCDRLSIVCYHSDVEVRLPLRHMDDPGKAAARAAIAAMKGRGSTNLSGGIIAAIDQLNEMHPGQHDMYSRAAAVFVLTDGFPTCGITNRNQLLQSVSAAHESVCQTSCPISAFGFGESHDSVMLSSLAQPTEGTYCFIEHAEGIVPAFAECLGSLQTLVAQNVKLHIEPENDAALVDVLSSYPEESSTPRVINFGDLRVDEQKDIVVEIDLPVLLVSPGAPQAYLSMSLSYWDVAEGRSHILKHIVSINRENDIASSPRLDVEVQRQRVQVSRAMLTAQQGSIITGRAVLAAAQAALDASPAAVASTNCDLIGQLRRDLQQCLNGFADQRSYMSSGQHTLSTALSEHSRQRSVSGSLRRTSSYRTRSQTEAIRRASSTEGSGHNSKDSPAPRRPQHQENHGNRHDGISAASIASDARLRIDRSDLQRVLPLDESPETTQAASMIGGKYRISQELLGGGGTGSVYRGYDVTSKTFVAIKTMQRARIDCHHELLEQFRRELNISLRLDHPNIVRLLDVAFDANRVFLVQELADGGDLFELVRTAGALPDTRARGIFRQLVSAVSYCHSRSVFHRDIKMENIVLVRNEGSDVVKLTDFGLAKDCTESFEGPKTMQVGTISFMAPEIVGCAPGRDGDSGYAGAPVDVWGLGCTLFVMTTGEFPFGEDSSRVAQTFVRIQKGAAGIDWEFDSQGRERAMNLSLQALLQGMLPSNPDERLDVNDVIASVWVQGDDGYADVSSTMEQQASQQLHCGDGALETVESLESSSEHSNSRTVGGASLDGFDIALDVEAASEESAIALHEFFQAPAIGLQPNRGLSSATTRNFNESAPRQRVRAVQFAAAAPCIITADSSAIMEVSSRFHCSPMSNTHDATATAEATVEQAISIPPDVLVSQHEAIHQREQETMDRLLAEQLAEAEQADQQSLQEETQEDSPILDIPDGLECPITNELFEDPVMCTDGKSSPVFSSLVLDHSS